MKRLKVLLSAHEISPYQGSECAEGWNLATRIARYHDVTVLYARGSQFSPEAYSEAIEGYYAQHENEFGITFVPVPQPRATLWLAAINKRLSRSTSGIGLPFLYWVGYRLWQKSALAMARSLVSRGEQSNRPFDVCHHLTQIAFREPGYLWKLRVPFIWGPTGGSESLPIRFAVGIGLRSAVFEAIRSLSNWLLMSHGRRIRQAIHSSALIYAFSLEDQRRFRERRAARVEVMLDAGCEAPVAPAPRQNGGDRIRVLWCGSLSKRKALDILLEAVAGDDELAARVEIEIVGDGPLRQRYEGMIRRLNMTRVVMCGWLSRDRVFDRMRDSDVLVHTSYREATSNTIPEALSCGLPVLCHDIGGMSIAVTRDCGMKIPLVSYEDSIAGFRAALRSLSQDPRRLSRLRVGAVSRARELSWDAMAERIAEDYCLVT